MDNFSTGFIKKEIGGTALSKSKDKIRVTVIGGNAVEVTGSCTLIEWGKPKRSILMECGLLQGSKSLLEEYRANNANFKVLYVKTTKLTCRNITDIRIQMRKLDEI